MPPLSPTARTRLGRHAERARTDRADLHEVLDAGVVCHLAMVVDGAPLALPTAYGRIGDTLYVHGSSGSRSLRAAAGQPVCVTVTHLDGLVCARSAFNHSLNYRSAVIFATARLVTDEGERLAALRAVTEQLIPGRWEAVRGPSRKELAATIELAVDLTEASVKIRTGPPSDEPDDVASGGWAGVVPVSLTFGEPEPAPDAPEGAEAPAHIRALLAGGSSRRASRSR